MGASIVVLGSEVYRKEAICQLSDKTHLKLRGDPTPTFKKDLYILLNRVMAAGVFTSEDREVHSGSAHYAHLSSFTKSSQGG